MLSQELSDSAGEDNGGTGGEGCTSLQPLAGRVRAISLDVTGTLITHGEPVMKSYADAAVWARLPDPPSETELKAAFKVAYKAGLLGSPCFGGRDMSGRAWWRSVIRRVLDDCGRTNPRNPRHVDRIEGWRDSRSNIYGVNDTSRNYVGRVRHV